MFLSKAKLSIALLMAVGLTAAMAWQQPRSGAEAETKQLTESETKINALLQERLKTAQIVVDMVKKQYATGTVSTEDMQRAYLRFHKAELDLCDTDKDRVAIHEKIVKIMKEQEDRAQALVNAGTATTSEMLDAKLNRLEAEIALERAKMKVAQGEK